MICRRCGGFVDTGDIICSACGALVDKDEAPETGVRAIRQGKKGASVPAATPEPARRRRAGASRPGSIPQPTTQEDTAEQPIPYVVTDTRTEGERGSRTAYGETVPMPLMGGSHARERRVRGVHTVKRHMVNWVHVIIALVLVLVLAVVGTYFYLSRTAEGQRIMARMGRDATSTALWEVGEEALDNGDLLTAIDNFLKARTLDGEDNVNVDGLLLLGTAYEAEGMTDEAMALYEEIYTSITPTRPEAYRNMIRLLEAAGRNPEAAELMQLAYEKTELATFRTMRSELLPAAPVADLTAGLYDQEKQLGILSDVGYDIYYTFNADAQLPGEGILYTGPITLTEGIYALRAVTVLDDLVSDELTGTYKIIMPSPQTPRTSLAPNTYKQRQRIWLKPGLDNEKDTDITIYYTIDGSLPDADSPVYTGEPFYLPGGGVTLRAVAVNGFGKASNTLEVYYKIEAKPYPLTAYSAADDTCNGLTLGITSREDFQREYGTGTGVEDVTLEGFADGAQRYDYSWGYAVMGKQKSGWVLAELCFTSQQFSGPRGTGIGNEGDFVVGKFRDMGQLASPSGNRGLYETTSGTGKIYAQEDGRQIITYTALTADNHTWQLDYCLNKSGVVDKIDMRYIP